MNPSMNERTGISRAVFVLIGLLLFSGAALLLTMFLLPPVYFARVTMEVKRDDSRYIFGGSTQEDMGQQFIAKQLSILRSKEILAQVVENLVLDGAWASDERSLSKDQALMRLAGSVEFRDLEGKGMIEIGAYGNDPQEAANIANTIAVVYQRKRLIDYDRVVDRGLAELKDAVEKQRQRAGEALAEAAAIGKRDGIIDPQPEEYDNIIQSHGMKEYGDYDDAKNRALQAKRIYEAVKTKYTTELLTHDESNPAKIWEKAEPPIKPIGFSFRRITHAFQR